MDESVQVRVRYLDSLRGIAALQVLLLHFLAAYFPSFYVPEQFPNSLGAMIQKTPLSFLYAGSAAVFIFFTLSGYVLTHAFATSDASLISQAGRRILRLGIPVTASVVFSAIVFVFFSGYNGAAGAISNSTWLRSLWLPPSDHWVVRDAFDALFIGYDESSIFRWLGIPAASLPSISTAFNAPLWTLSIEFYGSILIFVLNITRSRSTAAWNLIFVSLVFILWRSPLICFLAGHLAARHSLATAPQRGLIRPTFLIAAGVLASTTNWYPSILVDACALPSQLFAPCSGGHQSLMHISGAIMVTIGVMQAGWLRNILNRPSMAFLGKLSFPIYLVHWPIVFGLSAFLVVCLTPATGSGMARVLAVSLGLICSIVAAAAFTKVDALSIRASRLVGRLGGSHPEAPTAEFRVKAEMQPQRTHQSAAE